MIPVTSVLVSFQLNFITTQTDVFILETLIFCPHLSKSTIPTASISVLTSSANSSLYLEISVLVNSALCPHILKPPFVPLSSSTHFFILTPPTSVLVNSSLYSHSPKPLSTQTFDLTSSNIFTFKLCISFSDPQIFSSAFCPESSNLSSRPFVLTSSNFYRQIFDQKCSHPQISCSISSNLCQTNFLKHLFLRPSASHYQASDFIS